MDFMDFSPAEMAYAKDSQPLLLSAFALKGEIIETYLTPAASEESRLMDIQAFKADPMAFILACVGQSRTLVLAF